MAAPAGGEELHFSLSHAGAQVVLALAWRRRVGIDIEWLGQAPDYAGLAARLCSATERAWLGAHPPSRRPEAFLCLWTAREARLKASGAGWTQPASAAIEVLPLADGATRFLPAAGSEAVGWLLHPLPPPPPDCIWSLVAEALSPAEAAVCIRQAAIRKRTLQGWV